MGNLFKIFIKPKEGDDIPMVYINFTDVEPSEAEQDLIKDSQIVIQRIDSILEMMKNYGGIPDLIKQAIAKPSDVELQTTTWDALQPQIQKLKTFFDFSNDINSIFPKIIRSLFENNSFVSALETHPATMKAFGQIIDFCFRFDEYKASNPAVQNDFSYYRRVVSQKKDLQASGQLIIQKDEADKVSIFFANHTPFLNVLTQTINKVFPPSNPTLYTNALSCLSVMIKLCRHMIEKPELSSQFKDEDTKFFVLRVMVFLIILYDHVDTTGAFGKNKSFDVRSCIRVIKETPNFDPSNLLNVLRFTCKHINDEATPADVKKMLSE